MERLDRKPVERVQKRRVRRKPLDAGRDYCSPILPLVSKGGSDRFRNLVQHFQHFQGKTDQLDCYRADPAGGDSASAVRRCNKDNALDCRICLKDQSSLGARIVGYLGVELLSFRTERFIPDHSSGIRNLHPAKQASHTVTYQDNAVLQTEAFLSEREVFSQPQSGKTDWISSRVGKCPKLVAPPNHRVLQKSQRSCSPDIF